MSDNTSGKMSWTVAVLIGLVAAAILHWALGQSILSLIGGIIVAYAARELAPRGSSETQTPPVATPKPVQPTPAPVATPAPAPEPQVDRVAEAPADPAPAQYESHGETTDADLVKPSAPLAGEAELAGRKGSWRYEP